jgi:hypothetical protein
MKICSVEGASVALPAGPRLAIFAACFSASFGRLSGPALHTDKATKPPVGPQWIHEIKHDGYRLIARKRDDRVRLQTRNGFDWSDRYPRITEAVAALRVASATSRPLSTAANPGELGTMSVAGTDPEAHKLLSRLSPTHRAKLCSCPITSLTPASVPT